MSWNRPDAVFCLPVCLLVLAGCHRPANSGSQIRQFSENFVHESLALAPVAATAAGYHRHAGVNLDEHLDDYSEAGLARLNNFYSESLAQASALMNSSLPVEEQADLAIIRQQCERQLFDLQKLQVFRHNPTIYVETVGNALYTPYILHYASDEQRYTDITARLAEIPAFLQTAEKNLEDSPRIWTNVAEQENKGNLRLVDQTLRRQVPPDLQSRYNTAASVAIAALRSFDTFLQKNLSRREADWRLGPENYAAKFRLAFSTTITPQQVLTDAENALGSLRKKMYAEAAALYGKYYAGQPAPSDPNAAISQVLARIADTHVKPARYFEAAKQDLAEATAFVKSHHLVTLGDVGNLQIIPTPEFMRGLYGVGGFSPAPVLQPQLGSFYWITPFAPDMSPVRIESKLREYNRYGLQLLTIHEAMPGHCVQFEYANQVQPQTRRILRGVFADGPYVEGWAVHATGMMIDSGYEQSPQMQLTWEKHLLRVIANAILDIQLHTRGMTDAQALDLMEQQAFQEKEEAEEKLRRAKLSSCQLPTYFVGWRAWDDLEQASRKQQGPGFQMKWFNDAALAEGAVPMSVLRKLMLNKNLN